ncbi:MAG: hypothetical protein JOZ97_02850 [Candidatus Eremiobacteraeota bacterium]|nr:hypothetical protein [Candidatus Eremiobacteraeota bacterium]
MNSRTVMALLRAQGIVLEFADLGVYAECELRSEFDPAGPIIRINMRLIDTMSPERRDPFVTHAIAHELFHYFEDRGDVQRVRDRKVREANAERFAQNLAATLR